MEPTLNFLEKLVRGAGEILQANFGSCHKIQYKGAIDLVTDTDHQSEEYLLSEIRGSFPQHAIVTEESGSLAGQDCCVWYVDPLDGTVNFAHGVPLFTVCVAYKENGVLKYGAVYEPIRDECYLAEIGKGAWLNGQPLHIDDETGLDQALLVTGFAYDIRTNPKNNLDNYVNFSLCSQGVRRLGSAALDLCYVAAGRFDGYWEIQIKPWDIAAGGLIASEAGARVTNIHGQEDFLVAPCSILAAKPKVHTQMLDVLQQRR